MDGRAVFWHIPQIWPCRKKRIPSARLSRRPPLVATGHYHPIESGLQDFRRPLTLSLSPSDGERVAVRPGEGNTCVTSLGGSVSIPKRVQIRVLARQSGRRDVD